MKKNKCTCGKKDCNCENDKKVDSKSCSCGVDKGDKLGDYTVTVTDIAGYLDYATNKFKMVMKKNPYIPKVIYSDPEMGTTAVEWEDGDKTKVSCAEEDNYSWEAGFYAALAIKVLADGKKADMKNKWLPVLSRRVKEIGMSSTTFNKIEPLPYGKWEDEQKARKEFKKALKEELKKQAEEEEAKNVKNTKKAKGSKGK